MTEARSDGVDRPWMTPLLNRIAGIAGEKAAVILGHEKACRLIYIPNTVSEGHWLAELIGLEPARALAEHFGSQKLLIPPVLNGSKRQRADAIARLSAEGLSLNEVAAILGVARSTVIDHRAKAMRATPLEKKQGLLF